MIEIISATLKSGVRSRYIQGLIFLAFALVAVAYFTASFSPRQPRTVSLDVGLSGLRISLVLLSLFWVQEMLAREIDRRTVLFFLSFPIGRGAYLLGRFCGMALLGLLATVALTLALTVAVVTSGLGYEAQQYLPSVGLPFWTAALGIWLDSLVVMAFALAIGALSSTPVVAFAAGAGFAVAAKGLGAAIQYLREGAGGDKALQANLPMVEAIHWLLPDLSRLDWRLWPMYQMTPSFEAMAWAVVSAVAYATVFLAIAVWAFSRRELG